MELTVGRLGRFAFEPGWYIYTGSAMNSLDSRLARHYYCPSDARLHWHIDYLAPHGCEKQFRVLPPGEIGECGLNRLVGAMPGAVAPVRKFGSSDCSCRSHLYRLARRSWPDITGLMVWKPAGI